MGISGRVLCALGVLAAVGIAAPARGADVLVYGPSLAPANGGDGAVTLGQNGATDAPAGPTVVNEATIAADHGHNVTIVDAATWSGMTPEQFAAYDAIVIGDAGCDFSDGEDLAAVDGNKSVWSPVVTGNVAMNTFDAFYHIFQDATVEAGARALAGSGIDFAASGDGTGLYYSNGCRGFEACRAAGGCRTEGGGGYIVLDFLSEIGHFEIYDSSTDEVTVTVPGHPAMLGTSNENLSGWGSSTHSTVQTFPGEFFATAIGGEGGPERPAGLGLNGPVVIVRGGGGTTDTWVEVPTLSPAMLGLLALGLAAAAIFVLRPRARARG